MDLNDQAKYVKLLREATTDLIERTKAEIQQLKEQQEKLKQQLQEKEGKLSKLEKTLEDCRQKEQLVSSSDLTEDDGKSRGATKKAHTAHQRIDRDDEEDDRKPTARTTPRHRGLLPSYLESEESSDDEDVGDAGLTKTHEKQKRKDPPPPQQKQPAKRTKSSHACVVRHESFSGKSSIGKTRMELNGNTRLVKHMGRSSFSQSAVRAKGGKVYAVVLNDQWNKLATSTEENQVWYVGSGSGRRRLAELVVNTATSIPIFQAPIKKQKFIFYVGHYKVAPGAKHFEEPLHWKGKDRQMIITFQYDFFSQELADMIAETS
jgi:hypothetical protein